MHATQTCIVLLLYIEMLELSLAKVFKSETQRSYSLFKR